MILKLKAWRQDKRIVSGKRGEVNQGAKPIARGQSNNATRVHVKLKIVIRDGEKMMNVSCTACANCVQQPRVFLNKFIR